MFNVQCSSMRNSGTGRQMSSVLQEPRSRQSTNGILQITSVVTHCYTTGFMDVHGFVLYSRFYEVNNMSTVSYSLIQSEKQAIRERTGWEFDILSSPSTMKSTSCDWRVWALWVGNAESTGSVPRLLISSVEASWRPSIGCQAWPEHFQPGTTRHSWRSSEIFNKYLSIIYCHIVSYDHPSFS